MHAPYVWRKYSHAVYLYSYPLRPVSTTMEFSRVMTIHGRSFTETTLGLASSTTPYVVVCLDRTSMVG